MYVNQYLCMEVKGQHVSPRESNSGCSVVRKLLDPLSHLVNPEQ